MITISLVQFLLPILVAVVSIIGNIWQMIINHQSYKKNKRYEEILKKAILNAEFFQDINGDYRFRVRNSGESTARNIVLASSDIGFISQPEESEDEKFTLYVINGDKSISKLDKDEYIDYFAIVFCGNKEHPEVTITWDDNFSTCRSCTRISNALFQGRYSGNIR